MDVWEIFSFLCQKVVEEQNVFLDIHIDESGLDIQLMPIGEDMEEEE